MTRHNYSRWRRPGNLKAKTSVLKLIFSNIKLTLSFEKVSTILSVNIMFCGLKLFCCFSGGSL